MKIRALIADDEPAISNHLRRHLKLVWPELDIIAETGDGTQALRIMQEQKPDIAFLDIRMPGLSGIDIAWAAGEKCKIVYITAIPDHALDAFSQGAFDYVVKPVTSRRLSTTIRRLKAHFEQIRPPEPPAPVTEHQAATNACAPTTPVADARPGPVHHPWFCVKTSADMRVIQHKDIIYMESAGNYVRIVSQNDTGTMRQKLHVIMEKLPPGTFIQIHRCTIVNTHMIKSVHRERDGARLLLHGASEELQVSRQYMKHFFGAELPD